MYDPLVNVYSIVRSHNGVVLKEYISKTMLLETSFKVILMPTTGLQILAFEFQCL